jgi:transmembrane sensor
MSAPPNFHEQAARWHARTMVEPLCADEEGRLDAWLAADLRHRAAYTDIVAAGLALRHARPRACVATRAARHWPARLAAAVGVSVLSVLLLAAPHLWQDWRSDFHTRSGEPSVQDLADGSHLQLDTDSAVRVSQRADAREVELLRGALAVEVAKDPQRPFRVHAGDVVVTAVGTRFVVTCGADGIEVGLIEGKVGVTLVRDAAPTMLEAGERLLIDTHGAARRAPIPPTAYAWSRGALVFDRVPIATALAELDRYVPERVVVAAGSKAQASVTATFPTHDPRAALDAVALSAGLRVSCVPQVVCVVRE